MQVWYKFCILCVDVRASPEDEIWSCYSKDEVTYIHGQRSDPVCSGTWMPAYAWNKGASQQGLLLPQGAAFRLGQGTPYVSLVLQVHYDMANPLEKDYAGLRIHTSDSKMQFAVARTGFGLNPESNTQIPPQMEGEQTRM